MVFETPLNHPALVQNRVIFVGHGAYIINNNQRTAGQPPEVVVPVDTTITFWVAGVDRGGLGVNALDDEMAGMADSGELQALATRFRTGEPLRGTEPRWGEVRLPVTYSEGELVPNYMLLPPCGLNIVASGPNMTQVSVLPQLGRTVVVYLKELLLQFAGNNCHWAACRSNIRIHRNNLIAGTISVTGSVSHV